MDKKVTYGKRFLVKLENKIEMTEDRKKNATRERVKRRFEGLKV